MLIFMEFNININVQFSIVMNNEPSAQNQCYFASTAKTLISSLLFLLNALNLRTTKTPIFL